MFDYIQNSIQLFFQDGFLMYPIFIMLIVGICIQGTKIIIDLIKYKKIRRASLFAAGGFPSFHSGISTCVTTFALLEYGFDSIIFAITFTFSMLFAYDAMNIRYQAGQQARYINSLRGELQGVLSPSPNKILLKERIGHTPWEVFGGIVFGFVLTFLLYYRFYIAG